MAMQDLGKDVAKLIGAAKLGDAVHDVDTIINLLTAARGRVAEANDTHTTSLTLTKLQNPIKEQLDGLSGSLNKVHKGQAGFNKSLKAAFAKNKDIKGALPTEHDPMASQTTLINRAIAMHLLREGEFGVASTFIGEAQPDSQPSTTAGAETPSQHTTSSTISPSHMPYEDDNDAGDDTIIPDADIPADLTALQSHALQSSFADMYSILSSLKARDLLPAINWARNNCDELEARGSNIEFELCKLQYIWLFKGPSVNGLPAGRDNGLQGALEYGRRNFGRHQRRHLREIRQLSCAMIYAPNLEGSPYRSIFDIRLAFDEVAASFTREFCSLLGLSAESPLYVAATAGVIALPQLVKFTVRARGTEWTTAAELAFETPLPPSMVYHPIFVCPVSKEQTTDTNPPMILPCGHVLAKESLQRVTKGSRYKCPYCPSEGLSKDAKEIIL
ncbi:CTLH/CRA C-terminal to lish motif domain-containing protein [Xylariomycetidae sp. FL2044]|nr:CTLH/CRA C-terminal to lish motif domain-containing protein [Xylariomycetidae sp. FL2044]